MSGTPGERARSCGRSVLLGCGIAALAVLVIGVILVTHIGHGVSGLLDAHTTFAQAGVVSVDGGGDGDGQSASAGPDVYAVLLAACLGIGLSAASGLRVFIPPLILAIAARSGYVVMAPEWHSIFGSDFALIVLIIAALAEIVAYYVPWLDNALDTIALPAATVAGLILTAACTTQMSPELRWPLIVIAGGAQAALVQTVTATARLGSTVSTGGLGNHVLSTLEAGGSGVLSILSVGVPLLAACVVLVVTAIGIVHFRGRLLRRTRWRASG